MGCVSYRSPVWKMRLATGRKVSPGDAFINGNFRDAFSKRENNFYKLGIPLRKHDVLEVFIEP